MSTPRHHRDTTITKSPNTALQGLDLGTVARLEVQPGGRIGKATLALATEIEHGAGYRSRRRTVTSSPISMTMRSSPASTRPA